MPFEDITLEVLAKSDRALLLTDGDVEEWIPVSQIDEVDVDYISKGDTLPFAIKRWILEDKGFI